MKVVIWSKNNCNFCTKAKELLTTNNITYEEYVLGENATKEELLKLVPNARTVPQIFIDNAHIGGYTELAEFVKILE